MERTQTDVVVIGSGMGGMCAAALLAHRGYRTVVLESMGFLGGRFSSIDYKGYKIATGGHMVNHGKDDPIYQTLVEVGAPEIEFKEFQVPVKYRIAGKDYDLAEKGGLGRIISIASGNQVDTEKVMTSMYTAIKEREPSDEISLKDWLLQATDNENIHNIFQCQAASFTGVNAHDFPAGEFFRFLRTYARLRGTLVPKDSGKSVAHALKTTIENRKGQVFTCTRAVKILIDGGKATGVIVQREGKKQQIDAKVVISNIGPKKTIELAGKDYFEESYLDHVSQRVRASVAMDYIIVSDEPLLDCLLFTPQAQRTEAWSPTSLLSPEEAPPGKFVIEGYAAPRSNHDYDVKEEYEVFLQDLNREFPMFEKCGGQVLLARQFCGNWPVNRCFQGHDLPQNTPIDSLYNVGDGVKPSGWVGASGAAQSGRWVAERIVQMAESTK